MQNGNSKSSIFKSQVIIMALPRRK